jgi:O-methyltransferase involved in polyketide biosynthesis
LSNLESHKEAPEGLSLTATFIMIKLWGLLQYDTIREAFPEVLYRYTDRMVRDLPPPLHLFHELVRPPILRKVLARLNEFGLKGDLGHILARKKVVVTWLDDVIKKHQDRLQCVFLGSGLDFAPFYSASHNIQTFSLEMPSTIKVQEHFLKKQKYRSAYHHLISSPPGAPLYEVLHEHPKFSKEKRTLLITEGFWDYLPPNRVHSLMGEIQALADGLPELELWSTLFVLDELPWYYQWSYRQSVRGVGEELTFSYTSASFQTLLKRYNATEKTLLNQQELEAWLAPFAPAYPVLGGFYIGKWQWQS